MNDSIDWLPDSLPRVQYRARLDLPGETERFQVTLITRRMLQRPKARM